MCQEYASKFTMSTYTVDFTPRTIVLIGSAGAPGDTIRVTLIAIETFQITDAITVSDIR